MAKRILCVAHVILGLLATAASLNAKKIASKIDAQQLRDAALSYPSVATDADYSNIRIGFRTRQVGVSRRGDGKR